MINVFISVLIKEYEEKLTKFFGDISHGIFVSKHLDNCGFVFQLTVIDNRELPSIKVISEKLIKFMGDGKLWFHGFYIHDTESKQLPLFQGANFTINKKPDSNLQSANKTEIPEDNFSTSNFKDLQPLIKFINDLN